MALKPGWVDALAKRVAAEHAGTVEPERKQTLRRTSLQDYESGLKGSRKGSANTTRRLARVLGPIDEDD